MKILFTLILTFAINTICIQAQVNDDLIEKSIDFLDSKFHLNLKKVGQNILVLYNEDYFIFSKYYCTDSEILTKVEMKYEIYNIRDKKFGFSFNLGGSILSGSFEIVEDEDGIYFINLFYQKIPVFPKKTN